VFLRGQIGPCPKWMAELDLTAETAAIEEKWIRTGKMLSWYMVPSGFRLIGPKFLGVGEEHGLSLWFYTFPDIERFKEWALGAPEHIALHTKMVDAMKAGLAASARAGQAPLPSYSFHGTDDPNADIPAIRAELREMYRKIETMEWANMPPGSIQVMMLGDAG
jgi:hypothetical protein